MNEIQVLIVEDDWKNLEINRRFTEKVEGFSVCGVATTVEEAKELIDILKPNLVLLDVYLPDGDGINLLWYLRTYKQDIDVIMITAAKEVDRVEEAIRGGVFDFLIKPIMLNRLKQSLRKYREYKGKLKAVKEVTQGQVDRLLHRLPEHEEVHSLIPKGIDPLTLKKVKSELANYQNGITADEFGQSIGISRTTARRYLEYLVSTGEVHADLSYGKVGRPERTYIAYHIMESKG